MDLPRSFVNDRGKSILAYVQCQLLHPRFLRCLPYPTMFSAIHDACLVWPCLFTRTWQVSSQASTSRYLKSGVASDRRDLKSTTGRTCWINPHSTLCVVCRW